MLDQEQADVLTRGGAAWNEWRSFHPDTILYLDSATLSGLLLIGANLSSAHLSGANISGSDLSRAKLDNTELRNACLDATQLPRANLRHASLTRASLRGANLRYADLSEADLSGADLRGANLTGAALFSADLREAQMSGSILADADMRQAYLQGASLHNADLRRANLNAVEANEVDLSNANLSRADLSDSEIRHARFQGAVLDDCYMRDANLSDSDLSRASLHRTILHRTDLSDCNLTGCAISGLSCSDLRLNNTIDSDLQVTQWNGDGLKVDGLWPALLLDALLQANHAAGHLSKFILVVGDLDEELKDTLRARGHTIVTSKQPVAPERSNSSASIGNRVAHAPLFTGTVSIERMRPEYIPDLGSVCYESFLGIALQHGFQSDLPDRDMAVRLIRTLTEDSDTVGFAAFCDGKPAGSAFLSVASKVGGIGPVTVDSRLQGRGIGGKLMEALLQHADQHGLTRLRLTQDSYNVGSLSLYTSLGFTVKEAIALIQIAPAANVGAGLRPMRADDRKEIEELSIRLYKVDRSREVAAAMRLGFLPLVKEVSGRITGYFVPTIRGHGVAETDADMLALMQQAARDLPASFVRCFCPTGDALYKEALDRGCRTIKVCNLMALGEYERPEGAWIPSILY